MGGRTGTSVESRTVEGEWKMGLERGRERGSGRAEAGEEATWTIGH